MTGPLRRTDDSPDALFYATPRLVLHLDDRAVAAVSALYDELGVPEGDVLDLMSSWVSHLPRPARRLTVLGMNAVELDANPAADVRVVHDLNADPRLPFDDASFDAVVNCVSVDYLVRPVEVLAEVARVLRPGGLSVCTWSNRCFPTKAVHAWLATDEDDRPALVAGYHRAAGGFDEPVAEQRLDGRRSDPLWAVWGEAVGVTGVDAMVVEVVEVLPAPPERVWDLLSDVERTAGLGPEHASASWAGPERGAGAVFLGVNERWGRRWEVPCRVVVAERPAAFGWEVGDPALPTAWWTYRLAEVDGGTAVTQGFRHGPGRSFLRHAVGQEPQREQELVAERAEDLAANMRTVLRAAAALL